MGKRATGWAPTPSRILIRPRRYHQAELIAEGLSAHEVDLLVKAGCLCRYATAPEERGIMTRGTPGAWPGWAKTIWRKRRKAQETA